LAIKAKYFWELSSCGRGIDIDEYESCLTPIRLANRLISLLSRLCKALCTSDRQKNRQTDSQTNGLHSSMPITHYAHYTIVLSWLKMRFISPTCNRSQG